MTKWTSFAGVRYYRSRVVVTLGWEINVALL